MADERPQLPDFYAVLGVGFDATEAELRSAWRTAVKQWHPDRNRSPEAHGMMTRINEAWEVLGDAERRAEYDTVYFTLRAAMANAERKQREEERLERERRERLRRQEQERKRREEEAARKRAIEEEERRERARRERERREAEARRKAEQERKRREQEKIEKERREKEQQERARRARERREQERIEKQRLEQEREQRLRQWREEEDRKRQERWELPGPPGGTGYGRSEGSGFRPVAWVLGIVGVAALILVVAVFVANWIDEQNASDRTVAQVAPTPRVARGTATPRIVYVRATPGPTTRTVYVTASVDRTRREHEVNSEPWRATPAPTKASVAATPTPFPTPTPDPDLEWLDAIQPGSVHEYLLIADNPTGAEVTRMIAAGAEFGYVDEIGFGSLFLAVVTGAGPDVVTTLIDAGEDVTNSPQLLHALMWSDNPTVEVARVLIGAGADVLHTDHNGQMPLDIAIERPEVPDAVYVMIRDATEATVEQVRVVATPMNTPTATPAPTAAPVTSTPPPTVTSTLEPTATAVPTATPPMTPTATITPTPSPARTATPVAESNEVATKALWAAVSRGNRATHDEVVYLIALGADVSVLNSIGQTMFEYAVGRGYPNLVVRLLSTGLSVEAATQALWSAMSRGNRATHDEVVYLIGLGADVSVLNSIGQTMFEYAVGRNYDRDVIELLVDSLRPTVSTLTPTAKPAIRFAGSGTALHELLDRAPVYVESEQVRVLIAAGAPVDSEDRLGRTPLDIAVSRGHSSTILTMLIEAGASGGSGGLLASLLDRAPVYLETAQLRTLLDAGASISTVDNRGLTPLQVAVSRGHSSSVLSLLIDSGADAERDGLLASLLDRAPVYLDAAQVRVLLDAGASVSSVNTRRLTPLEVAVSRGHSSSVLTTLIEAGADARSSDRLLHSLLDRAPVYVEVAQVRVLLEAGASLAGLDNLDRTPLDVAVARGHDADIISLLIGATATRTETPTATPSPTPRPSTVLTLRGSGTLHEDASDEFIGCPARINEPAFIASDAIVGSIEFSFEVPRAPGWSIGLIYHIEDRVADTATFVYGFTDVGIRVAHWTQVGGQNVDSVEPIAVASNIFDATAGALNKVAIRVDRDGTELVLNGSLVLDVPASELRPRSGGMQVCVGFLTDEPQDYLIDYIGLRAWTE